MVEDRIPRRRWYRIAFYVAGTCRKRKGSQCHLEKPVALRIPQQREERADKQECGHSLRQPVHEQFQTAEPRHDGPDSIQPWPRMPRGRRGSFRSPRSRSAITTQARLAQRKVTLHQLTLLWRNVDFFGATLGYFAPTQPSLAQGWVSLAQRGLLWRNVAFFDAKSASLAQRKVTLRQGTLHRGNVASPCAI